MPAADLVPTEAGVLVTDAPGVLVGGARVLKAERAAVGAAALLAAVAARAAGVLMGLAAGLQAAVALA